MADAWCDARPPRVSLPFREPARGGFFASQHLGQRGIIPLASKQCQAILPSRRTRLRVAGEACSSACRFACAANASPCRSAGFSSAYRRRKKLFRRCSWLATPSPRRENALAPRPQETKQSRKQAKRAGIYAGRGRKISECVWASVTYSPRPSGAKHRLVGFWPPTGQRAITAPSGETLATTPSPKRAA